MFKFKSERKSERWRKKNIYLVFKNIKMFLVFPKKEEVFSFKRIKSPVNYWDFVVPVKNLWIDGSDSNVPDATTQQPYLHLIHLIDDFLWCDDVLYEDYCCCYCCYCYEHHVYYLWKFYFFVVTFCWHWFMFRIE